MPCIVITPPSRLPMRRRRRWHRPPQSCHRRQPFISRHHPSTAVQSHLLSGCLLVTVAETRLCRVSSSLRRRTTMDGIFPRRRRDGDGCGDAAVPSDRRRRRLRRGRGTTRREGGGEATTRDESGRWTTQGERVESDEGATRWRRAATEVRGEEAACREVSTDQNQS